MEDPQSLIPQDCVKGAADDDQPSPLFQSPGEGLSLATPADVARVFQHMIEGEIDRGSLPHWRRRRIIRFGLRLGISPCKSKKLIERCLAPDDRDGVSNVERSNASAFPGNGDGDGPLNNSSADSAMVLSLVLLAATLVLILGEGLCRWVGLPLFGSP